MPRRARSNRLQRGDVGALPHHTAGADPLLADERAQQAGLADAVAAQHASDLAGLGLERDASQRLRGAVMKVDAVDFEHSYRPR